MTDTAPDNLKPDDTRDNKGRFAPGNKIGAKGRGKGAKAKLTKEIHELIEGTIARRGQRCRAKLAKDGVDVSGLTDPQCWIDSLDEDQFLKLLTHMLPKGVELSALGEDGEPARPIIVMYGTEKYESAIQGDAGNGSDG